MNRVCVVTGGRERKYYSRLHEDGGVVAERETEGREDRMEEGGGRERGGGWGGGPRGPPPSLSLGAGACASVHCFVTIC